MNSHILSFIGTGFECYQSFSFQSGCVKGKGNNNGSISFFWNKFGFSSNLFVVDKKCFSCFFVHQGSRHGIFFTRNQSLVRNCVFESNFFVCESIMALAFRILYFSLDMRNIHGLLCVIDIFMLTNDDFIITLLII